MARRGMAGGSYKPLTDEAVSKIDDSVMRVIEEVGFQVNSSEAMHYYLEAGAKPGDGENTIRMSREKVMELVGKAPSQVLLAGQDEVNDVVLGGNGGT